MAGHSGILIHHRVLVGPRRLRSGWLHLHGVPSYGIIRHISVRHRWIRFDLKISFA